ncbi:MAG: hypothetical protein LKM45_04730 [Wolbachia endosymbiont of Alcedoecus sp.]|nr:hypothetical protein [Wolbachia endosymbiont of Alcedoecus sp.]
MAKGNNALLIFDFDNTITNEHMHNVFSGRYSGFKKSDFNSGAEYAVTDNDIEGFMKEKGGIKNEETLKPVLQSALSSGVEVNIASYTGYPNAVKRVVENHLGLSKEQADSISVFGGFPADYDIQLKSSALKEQQNQVGKNLHICRAIVEYKDKHGQLPKTVMLVDDSADNIKKIDEFVKSMSKREGWLKENGLSIEEIQKIKFEGVQVPKESKNVDYLGKVQEFISVNLVQEPIYENLRKEEPIYQNLHDIHESSSEKELSPPLPPKKRKSSDGMGVDGENKKQDIKSSEAQAELTRSKRHAMMLDTQQVTAVLQNTEGLSPGKKYTHTETLSLLKAFETIRDFFQDCGQKVINTIHRLLKKEVITGIKEQGYDVNSEKGKSKITVYGNKSIDIDKIKTDFIDTSLIRIMELDEKKIKDLGNNYKGDQLEREILKLLNADLQKENINLNSVGGKYSNGEPTHQTREEALLSHQQIRGNYNDGEPIFQSLEELGYHPQQKKDRDSNSVRGNYNDGEPIHQTVQEVRNYHQQRRDINPSSMNKKPLAPPLPPKSRMEEVRAEGKTKTVEKS